MAWYEQPGQTLLEYGTVRRRVHRTTTRAARISGRLHTRWPLGVYREEYLLELWGGNRTGQGTGNWLHAARDGYGGEFGGLLSWDLGFCSRSRFLPRRFGSIYAHYPKG